MKTLMIWLGKFLQCVLSALIVTLLIIAWMTMQAPRNEERIGHLQAQLAEKKGELARIDAEIAQRDHLSKWDLGKKLRIKYLEVYRPKCLSDISVIHADIVEARGGDWFDIFLTKCNDVGLNYFCYFLGLFLFAPLLFSLFMYYCVAIYVERCKSKTGEDVSSLQKIGISVKKSSMEVLLAMQERLYFRGNWIGERSGVSAKTKMMWQWRSPLITLAAELFELKAFCSLENEKGKIKITAPEADLYIGQIELKDGASIVISPRHLIGVSDSVQIKTRWNLNLHSLLAGKLRQVVLYGTGRLFVYGFQGIDHEIIGEMGCKIEANRLIGYEL